MTAANPTSQPEPRLSMTAITIELQGDALVSTEEDVSRISWYTGARQIRFTREADGSIEAILGNSRLNIAPNRTKLTRGLRSHPALAGIPTSGMLPRHPRMLPHDDYPHHLRISPWL